MVPQPEPMERQAEGNFLFDNLEEENAALKIENDFLRSEKWCLQKEVEMFHPTKSILLNKDNLLLHTGIPKI